MVPLGLFHLCFLILCSLQAQRMAGARAETQLKGSEKCLSKEPSEAGQEVLTHFFCCGCPSPFHPRSTVCSRQTVVSATLVQACDTQPIWQTEIGISVKTIPKTHFLLEGLTSFSHLLPLEGHQGLEDILPQVWQEKQVEGSVFYPGKV